MLKALYADDELANDPQISDLGVPGAISKLEDSHTKLKQMQEKVTPLWRSQIVKQADKWKDTMDEFESTMSEFELQLEELKQLVQIVSDVKAGMKREALKVKKAAGYKVTKYTQALKAGCLPDDLGKAFAEAYSKVLDDEKFRGIANLQSGVAVVAGGSGDSDKNIASYMASMVADNKETLQQEALSLVGQMRGTSIMKPLKLDKLRRRRHQ